MTRRLLASYLLLTVAVLLVLEIPLGLNFAAREEQDLTQNLQIDAFALGSYAEEVLEDPSAHGDGDPDDGTAAGEHADLQATADAYAADTGARVVIVDSTGLAVADSDPSAEGDRYFDEGRPEIAAALDGQVATGTRSSETLGGRILYAAVPVASGGVVHGAVRLSYSTHELDERVRDNWLRLGLIALVSMAAATGLGILLAQSVTRPVRDLQRSATTLGAGDLSVRADAGHGPAEVRALAVAFNDMAARLGGLVEAQEAFVADASHQLRNPLTALRLRLENLEDTVDDPDRGEVEAAEHEVARMSRLVDGLLALARADRASSTTTVQDVDVVPALTERAEVWAPLADEREVRIDVDGGGDRRMLVRATPDRLAQVLDNLIANALDAAPVGSVLALRAVRVDAPGGPARVEIHVVDGGPGLSDEDRDRAFDRFWRAGRDAGPAGGLRDGTSGLGGSGLGLAIVKKLVDADNGTIELRARVDGTAGLDACVSYPAAPS